MTSGAQVAADALRYLGRRYVRGGWDCSGMVNHVLSADLGMAIPGFRPGQFQGPPPHGPVVSDYLSWNGAQTVAGPPLPGDLCIFGPDTHIGIAITGTTMVSALNPELGTRKTPIAGTAPGDVTYRRLLELGGTVPFMSQPATSAGQFLGRLVVAGVVAVAAAGLVVFALSAGAAALAGGVTRAGR